VIFEKYSLVAFNSILPNELEKCTTATEEKKNSKKIATINSAYEFVIEK
jgi:hypothetical protein